MIDQATRLHELLLDADDISGFLDELGVKAVTIVDPGVSKAPYAAYDDGEAKGVFLKTSAGEDYVGRVWPGDTVFPDFSRADAREYWATHHAALFDQGVSGHDTVMGLPSSRDLPGWSASTESRQTRKRSSWLIRANCSGWSWPVQPEA